MWRQNDGDRHARRKDEMTDWKMAKKKKKKTAERERGRLAISVPHTKSNHESSLIY